MLTFIHITHSDMFAFRNVTKLLFEIYIDMPFETSFGL